MTQTPPAAAAASARPSAPLWQKLLPFAITAVCLVILYSRLEGAAARQGMGLVPYLAEIFARVSWFRWLGLMIPYCILFFLIDTLVLWKVVNWFNTRIGYAELIPVRGAAYILSIVNEQVSKGAVGLYLNRRANVPGWEVGSSMLFIMVCEIYYLLIWATIGVFAQWDKFPEVFHAIPSIAAGGVIVFTLSHLYFSGRIAKGLTLREKPIFHAFRKATVANYLSVVLMRSPALVSAAVVYTLALRLFGVEANFGEMLGYLPVIFFGAATPGPMRSVAILLWVLLFPNNPGEMTAFGFVQHNFFILFNAAMGLIFIKRATADLFGPSSEAKA
ncbi:MAG: hypothetical protein AB7I25_11630 [Vicinamibacterales bacterium]